MAYVMKVNAKYRGDSSVHEVDLPALLTQDGLIISHLRYLASNKCVKKSASWKERSVFALRLLVSFINANEGRYNKTVELLSCFAEALEFGTIDIEKQKDLSGLFWTPRKAEDARTLLNHITDYTDWLVGEPDYKKGMPNPFRKATLVEQRLNWCAYYHKKLNVFLGHVNDPKRAAQQNAMSRKIKTSQPPAFQKRKTKRFPESEVDKLLTNGWVRSNSSPQATHHDFIDYKGRAITILLHYAGLRKSEVFHLYLSDVVVDKVLNEAIVRIYHPAQGRVPEAGYTDRRDYLNRRYGMKPRNEYPKSHALHAGWKEPLLTDGPDGYLEVHFFPLAQAKEFLYNFVMYIKHQRVDPPAGADHPFAFTNTEGYPETIKNFNRQHRNAVERIGLHHVKTLGTTEHGHRHAYGYRLTSAELSPVTIQKAMHHKSPQSQKVYSEPTDEDVRAALERAERGVLE